MRRRRRALGGLGAGLALLLAAGCAQLGFRPSVGHDQARDLLDRAVALVRVDEVAQLCTLSAVEGSTCADSLEEVGDLAPADPPTVLCSVPLPSYGPLRNGHALVVQGIDAAGDPYITEWLVWHDGHAVHVLDAIYWSGLAVESYTEDTVAWRFNSSSTLCRDRALPRGVSG